MTYIKAKLQKTFQKKNYLEKKKKKTSLYLISPENFDLDKFSEVLSRILLTNTIKIFQLRLKNVEDVLLIKYIEKLAPICKKNNVTFILNDNPYLVKLLDLDGVHIGKTDISIYNCRKIIGKKKIIGKSCYNSPFKAIRAQNSGASYLAFGSFFRTETKQTFCRVNSNILAKWNNFKEIPVVAVGGINLFNYKKIRRLNLDFYALSSAVWNARQGALEYVIKFKNLIDNC